MHLDTHVGGERERGGEEKRVGVDRRGEACIYVYYTYAYGI